MATIQTCGALMLGSYRTCYLPLGHARSHVADDGWRWLTDQQILWEAAHGEKWAVNYCDFYHVDVPSLRASSESEGKQP